MKLRKNLLTLISTLILAPVSIVSCSLGINSKANQASEEANKNEQINKPSKKVDSNSKDEGLQKQQTQQEDNNSTNKIDSAKENIKANEKNDSNQTQDNQDDSKKINDKNQSQSNQQLNNENDNSVNNNKENSSSKNDENLTLTKVRLGHWNVLNQSGNIPTKNLAISKVILHNKLDLVGLTEITNENGVKTIINELNKSSSDKWNYIVSLKKRGTTGSSGQEEHVGIIYKENKLTLESFDDKEKSKGKFYENKLWDDPFKKGQKIDFVRPPFGVKFSTKGNIKNDFTVVFMHSDAPGVKEERGEISAKGYSGQGHKEVAEALRTKEVMEYFDSIDGVNNELFFMGDTNIKLGNEAKAFEPLLQSGYKSLIKDVKENATSLAQRWGEYANPYDKIFYKGDLKVENSGFYDLWKVFDDNLLNKEEFKTKVEEYRSSKKAKDKYKGEYSYVLHAISDHTIVYTDLILLQKDDQNKNSENKDENSNDSKQNLDKPKTNNEQNQNTQDDSKKISDASQNNSNTTNEKDQKLDSQDESKNNAIKSQQNDQKDSNLSSSKNDTQPSKESSPQINPNLENNQEISHSNNGENDDSKEQNTSNSRQTKNDLRSEQKQNLTTKNPSSNSSNVETKNETQNNENSSTKKDEIDTSAKTQDSTNSNLKNEEKTNQVETKTNTESNNSNSTNKQEENSSTKKEEISKSESNVNNSNSTNKQEENIDNKKEEISKSESNVNNSNSTNTQNQETPETNESQNNVIIGKNPNNQSLNQNAIDVSAKKVKIGYWNINESVGKSSASKAFAVAKVIDHNKLDLVGIGGLVHEETLTKIVEEMNKLSKDSSDKWVQVISEKKQGEGFPVNLARYIGVIYKENKFNIESFKNQNTNKGHLYENQPWNSSFNTSEKVSYVRPPFGIKFSTKGDVKNDFTVVFAQNDFAHKSNSKDTKETSLTNYKYQGSQEVSEALRTKEVMEYFDNLDEANNELFFMGYTGILTGNEASAFKPLLDLNYKSLIEDKAENSNSLKKSNTNEYSGTLNKIFYKGDLKTQNTGFYDLWKVFENNTPLNKEEFHQQVDNEAKQTKTTTSKKPSKRKPKAPKTQSTQGRKYKDEYSYIYEVISRHTLIWTDLVLDPNDSN
ncbi:MnuA family membrane nuclease [Mycoplasmopsis pulmonis]|uniref:MnuA family membrane nuclease n=1 Tax=Mycoplasmopsis pulmonis TaxID=2107 RepID=UPI00100501A6|nr:hypothetical protein [Mycoplasmopsis pulmonis]VEU68460.1 Uncharacterised protein [Mycoplasmopsis pulmonis]